jgi:hypothetical protein
LPAIVERALPYVSPWPAQKSTACMGGHLDHAAAESFEAL